MLFGQAEFLPQDIGTVLAEGWGRYERRLRCAWELDRPAEQAKSVRRRMFDRADASPGAGLMRAQREVT